MAVSARLPHPCADSLLPSTLPATKVIAVPILGGSGDYLDWLKANTLPR